MPRPCRFRPPVSMPCCVDMASCTCPIRRRFAGNAPGAEARRAGSGQRLGCWRSWFKLIYEAVKAYGTMDANLPHGPDFFQFASPQSMKAALTQAGFADCAANLVAQDWQVDDAHEYVDAILTGTVRARAVLAAQSSGAMESVKAFLAERLEEFRGQGGHIAIPPPPSSAAARGSLDTLRPRVLSARSPELKCKRGRPWLRPIRRKAGMLG